ncbi:MAG: OmpA family protein, partial [Myxococcales bacterium]|nr:OmpA family protein [Myxococcales bacterium]
TDGGGSPDGAELASGDDPLDPLDDRLGDPDRDGLTTEREFELGTNPRDTDTDRDGLTDGEEVEFGSDPTEADTDDDGMDDRAERDAGTNPREADSDGGGTRDGQEVLDGTDPLDGGDDFALDPDGDGLLTRAEVEAGTDPYDADSDDDGIADGDERQWQNDSDLDGLINARDADSDDDGLPDGLEAGVQNPNPDTDLSRGRFVADADPTTVTDPLHRDTDRGGVSDGDEDLNRNGRVDPGETDPLDREDDGTPPEDRDHDGLSDAAELALGLDPGDADSDDDGLLDGEEPSPGADADGDGLINALDPDSDDDRLPDGLEAGVSERPAASDPAVFRADEDPSTTTDPLARDTDGGGAADGAEDANRNGRVDPGETDPNLADDDQVPVEADGAVGDAGVGDGGVDAAVGTDAGEPRSVGIDPLATVHGGCAQGAGDGIGWLGLLLALGLLRRRRLFSMLMLVVCLLPALPAQAFEADRFAPSSTADGILGVDRARVDGHLTLQTGLWLRAQGATLSATEPDGATVELAGRSLRADMVQALTLLDRAAIALHVPVVLDQSGTRATGAAFDGGTAGDARLVLAGEVWRSNGGAVRLGLALPLTLPTGDVDRWSGADGVRFAPVIRVDATLADWLVLGSLGYGLRPDEALFATTTGDEIALAVAARYTPPALPFAVELSVQASTWVDDAFASGEATPIEAHGGLRWPLGECFALVTAAGGALNEGVGAAPWRALLGVLHACHGPKAADPEATDAPKVVVVSSAPDPDPDADGLTGAQDACPMQPEDKDGFDDADGCPDDDNDGDGIADTEDLCANQPEDKDGFEDIDGCPDDDNDRDGFPDAVDQCPNEAETVNHYRDDDGCPEDQIAAIGRARLDRGFIVLSQSINFKPRDAVLTEADQAVLADVAALLTRRPDLATVEIGAHTSTRGGTERNARLTRKRATAVRDALVAAGVAPERLRAVGYGEGSPIESNRTPAGRAANERIELRVLSP